MAPRAASSPSAVASTSRQLAGLLRNAAGVPRRHAGEASRLRPSSSAAFYGFSSGTLSSSSAPHLSAFAAASPRRSFSASPRSSAPPQYRGQAEEAPSLTPKKTTEELQAWFQERFPGVDLPDNVILQAATHESWNHGLTTDGHNRRLGFIGRRALQMFLTIFLHSRAHTSQKAAALLGSPDALADVLKTSRLGDKVGRTLQLEQVMRWTPAVLDGQRGPVETGLFKIRGVTVEALVGAIYHQHGAAVARSFFHANVLPNIETLDEATRSELASAIRAEANEGASVLASMADRVQKSGSVALESTSFSAATRPAVDSGSSSAQGAQGETSKQFGSAGGVSSSASPGRRTVGRMPTTDNAALHSEGGSDRQYVGGTEGRV
ncbi:hypothetical protein BCV69DRAFT_310547 [Microstroma glucosiphilum]|uniref:RNase III domain-containing protein n=1 Tax=Pseudomicrostroma glucosiphilum TaxID=1684307 RepID=A0A316UCY1_9BASI|nr:hypothetical protein BCV69DRAFT_310547 [Pseudomicrostroma glucosiphilum]PWN23056.1 hypothetical protein BCV69DRAFT_310547 [Pseudomicrostroma glucosiphilum]